MLQSMGLSCGSQPLRWILIASVVDIPKAGAVKFTYRQEGLSREGFLFLFNLKTAVGRDGFFCKFLIP
jgi:hypothetical protein